MLLLGISHRLGVAFLSAFMVLGALIIDLNTGVFLITAYQCLAIYLVKETMPSILWDYATESILILFGEYLFFYFYLKQSKISFLKSERIIVMLNDQKTLFNGIPDGAVIHGWHKKFSGDKAKRYKSQVVTHDYGMRITNGEEMEHKISFMNQTFLQMFKDIPEQIQMEVSNNHTSLDLFEETKINIKISGD